MKRLALAVALLLPAGALVIAFGAYSKEEPMLLAFDQGKCIESCDIQYRQCVDRAPNNPDHIKYCSGQHDSCRNRCLEHKG